MRCHVSGFSPLATSAARIVSGFGSCAPVAFSRRFCLGTWRGDSRTGSPISLLFCFVIKADYPHG
jgi:hypothetical protein